VVIGGLIWIWAARAQAQSPAIPSVAAAA
jgi:hypothetical protein